MKLPVVSGRQAVKAFRRIDYEVDRRVGSHIILRQSRARNGEGILQPGRAPYRRLTVPDHHEIAKGTLRTLIREAGLTVAEFRSLL